MDVESSPHRAPIADAAGSLTCHFNRNVTLFFSWHELH